MKIDISIKMPYKNETWKKNKNLVKTVNIETQKCYQNGSNHPKKVKDIVSLSLSFAIQKYLQMSMLFLQ